MARADLTKIRNELYSFLNVDGGSYGTYVANARYPSNAIDDAIYDADNFIGMLLAKGGQDSLMQGAVQSKSITVSGSTVPNAVDENWYISSVVDKITARHLRAVPLIQYELLTGTNPKIASFFGIYAIHGNQIFYINANDITVEYFCFKKDTTIKCPDGFEQAIAYRAASILLMKRADNPEAAGYYDSKMKEFLSGWINIEELYKQ